MSAGNNQHIITSQYLRKRLNALTQIRDEHVRAASCPIEEWYLGNSTDGEASFKREDDAMYYEVITGHIAEVMYLIAAAGSQQELTRDNTTRGAARPHCK